MAPQQNVGIIMGAPSGNLVDVDLDCPEALALASSFLPLTDSAFGRPSKRRSHLLYTSAVPKVMPFEDPTGAVDANGRDKAEMLVELRSTGGQTVFPGSTHESGEVIRWAEDGDPAEVDPTQLIKAVGLLAAACLLVRAAPADGRNRYMLEIAGALVRGLGADGAAHILAPVGRLVFGKLYSKAAEERLIADTVRKIAEGKPASGWPTLAKAIGDKRARKVSDWLGLSTQEPELRSSRADRRRSPGPSRSAPDAYHGIVGDIVRRIEPETEADPAALLFQLLAAAGNVLGAGAYARVEASRHTPRLWVTLVGRTSKGRKGTALDRVRELMGSVAPRLGAELPGVGPVIRRRADQLRPRPDRAAGEGRQIEGVQDGNRRRRRGRQAAAAGRGRAGQGAQEHGPPGQHLVGRAPGRLGPRQPAHPDQEQPAPGDRCPCQPYRPRHQLRAAPLPHRHGDGQRLRQPNAVRLRAALQGAAPRRTVDRLAGYRGPAQRHPGRQALRRDPPHRCFLGAVGGQLFGI